ncbi:MAG: S9 family peptidase [Polyangiaceae bacterium]|jgi:dipeptidyl aminopeptidase/acylaminoacyl peptidase|nr:S9 family peptidase [Polyangiaceae bacterium]
MNGWARRAGLWGMIAAVALGACGPSAVVPTPPPPDPLPDASGTADGALPPALSGTAPKAPVALEEYFKIRRVPPISRSGQPLLSFSHDEKVVAYASDEAGRIDVWVQPVGGGSPVQVTKVEGFVHSFMFSPKADLLVFEADRGGDELPRLFATDSKGKPAQELVPELPAGRRTQLVGFSAAGDKLVYLSNGREERAMDLVELDLKSKKSTILWQASGKLAAARVSPDKKRLAIIETHSDANSDVWLWERGAKAPELLTKHEGVVFFDPAAFSHDGQTLYVTSDEGSEFTRLVAIDLKTKKREVVLSDKWDVDAAKVSSTGKYFVTEVNANGVPKLTMTSKGKPVPLLPVPGEGSSWRVLEFSATDRFVGLTEVSDTSPATSYVADLEKRTLRRLVDPMPASLAQRDMVAGEPVEIPSFDGRKVPAFLYRPAGQGPFPALIDVHGGPTAQSKVGFVAFRQYLVSKGYAVLVPNVRGSTGYGKTYTRLDNLDLGGGPLKDVVACKRWLVERAKVDPNKVVVFGGSYGGYMALAAEAFTPDEFAANVDFFGVSDLRSLVESFPPHWQAFASYIYEKFGDPKNPAHAKYQYDRSPLNFTQNMKRPLLVVQGDKDARVKKDQSDRIVNALKDKKVPVHYLVLENEGHGFTKTENNLKALKLTDVFLDRYLFGDATTGALP